MILTLIAKNLKHRLLSTILSLLMLALSVCLISVVLHVQDKTVQQFSAQLANTDLVIGAKGSPLQLILSSVFQLDHPTGNIPLKDAALWEKHPMVKSFLPLSLGDNFKGFAIAGTTPHYLKFHQLQLAAGRNFSNPFEAVIGFETASVTQLKVGDQFYSSHGHPPSNGEKSEIDHHVHSQPYTVVGILQKTTSPSNKLIYTAQESIWYAHEELNTEDQTVEHQHDVKHREQHIEALQEEHHHEKEHEEHHHHEEEPIKESEKMITAALLQFKSPLGLIQLPKQINNTSAVMAAVPAVEMNRLFDLLGVGAQFLQQLAVGLLIVSMIIIFLVLLHSLNNRKFELAIMRSLGGNKSTILFLILGESAVLSLFGFSIGMVLSRITLQLLEAKARYQYGVSWAAWTEFSWQECWLLLGVLAIGLVAGCIPAIKAQQISISQTLRKK